MKLTLKQAKYTDVKKRSDCGALLLFIAVHRQRSEKGGDGRRASALVLSLGVSLQFSSIRATMEQTTTFDEGISMSDETQQPFDDGVVYRKYIVCHVLVEDVGDTRQIGIRYDLVDHLDERDFEHCGMLHVTSFAELPPGEYLTVCGGVIPVR